MAETRKSAPALVLLPRRGTLALVAAAWVLRPASRLAAVLASAASAIAPGASRAAPLASRDTDLADFDRLILQVPADVKIGFGDRSRASIKAEQKVIDSIAFRGEGNTLRVVAARSFDTREPIAISITCRRLSELDAHASVEASVEKPKAERFTLKAADSATVSLTGVNFGELVADIEGSATVTAAGKARSQVVKVSGAGTYDAGALQSETARVAATGSSDVIINSRDSLDAAVSGAATVQYAGNPKLKQSVEGAATLERI